MISLLFIKSFLVGIGKIIPGVSGAMLAINFNIYDKLVSAIVNFFPNWKKNAKFLLTFISGILLAIVIFSKIILILINNHKFITLMFFTGLIIGGVFDIKKELKSSSINIIVILSIYIITLFLSLGVFNHILTLKNNNLIFFLGGTIEIITSIIPGISGTAIFMTLGIYDEIINLLANILNYQYVINNFEIYLYYSLGMIVTFIICIILINYIIKYYHNIFYNIILGLSLSSITYMFILAFKEIYSYIELFIGIILLIMGTNISLLLNKK